MVVTALYFDENKVAPRLEYAFDARAPPLKNAHLFSNASSSGKKGYSVWAAGLEIVWGSVSKKHLGGV
jgi:hypothetical protein